MIYVLLIAGFVLLVKGADIFVDGSSAIARKLKIPNVIVGLTIVAFGTSAPEAAVSITAALKHSSGIAVGNVVGSNIFNLLVVAGICAILKPMNVNPSILKKDFPISIIGSIVLLLLTFGSVSDISRIDGLILLTFFMSFMFITIKQALNMRNDSINTNEKLQKEKSTMLNVFLTVVGCASVIIGGKLVVDNASQIAGNLGLSENLIGLTIVAIGTSLPELVTSLVAIKKSQSDIALGNVIGSNIFNIMFILGISAAINPIPIYKSSIYDIIILNIISLVSLVFAATKIKINRIEGLSMVAMYACYTSYIIVR